MSNYLIIKQWRDIKKKCINIKVLENKNYKCSHKYDDIKKPTINIHAYYYLLFIFYLFNLKE